MIQPIVAALSQTTGGQFGLRAQIVVTKKPGVCQASLNQLYQVGQWFRVFVSEWRSTHSAAGLLLMSLPRRDNGSTYVPEMPLFCRILTTTRRFSA